MLAMFVVNGPVYGGGHNQIVRLQRPLARRGWHTLAVVPDEPGNALERLREAGVDTVACTLHRLRATWDLRAHGRLAACLGRDVEALRKLIRERGVDVVQAHGVTQLHAPLAARREHAALVWELYDTRAPTWLRRVAMPLVTGLADVITTWGREVARVHPGAESVGERLITVFPPVDASRFRPDRARRVAARAELGVAMDDLLVGSIGNVNPQKGHEHLVRAAARTVTRLPDARFRVIGGRGTHPDYHRSLLMEVEGLGLDANGRFVFSGSSSRVEELLPAFDVLALTSVPRSEGMPTVIVEAMACGVPVVATNVAAVPEVVEHGVTGLVVPPDDPHAIAEALISLLAAPADRHRMGEAARARVLERFDIEHCADARVAAFEHALEHRGER